MENSCSHPHHSCGEKSEKKISKRDRVILVIVVVIVGIVFLRQIAARSLYISAVNFHGIGKKEKAISLLKKATLLSPSFSLAFEELGNIYEEDDLQKAIYYHQKAVFSGKDAFQSYTFLAKTHFKEKRYRQVISLCSPLLYDKKTNKDHILPLKFLCLSFEKENEKNKENICWEKILKIEPRDGMARGKLGK